MMTFTQDELYQAIVAAQRRPEETPNSVTTPELAAALECGTDRARRILRDAAAAGVVRPEWVRRVSALGIARRYEGYVLVEREAS